MAHYFQVFRGCIVTANPDGSVPINSMFVLEVKNCDEASNELTQALLNQANAYAKSQESE
jgi:hypothetical protein